MNVPEALATRKSIRAFKPDPVSRDTLEQILTLAAARAVGRQSAALARLCADGWRARRTRRAASPRCAKSIPMGAPPEYHIYPPASHRALQDAPLPHRRDDVCHHGHPARGQSRRASNSSPATGNSSARRSGLIFTMDRQMQQGQWADLGMFLQSIMLLAREHGLHTCAQEAWAVFHPTIRDYLASRKTR